MEMLNELHFYAYVRLRESERNPIRQNFMKTISIFLSHSLMINFFHFSLLSLVLISYFSFQFLLNLTCQECSSFLTEFTASLKEHSLAVDQEQTMLELLTNFNLLNEELHAGKFSTLPLFRYKNSLLTCSILL